MVIKIQKQSEPTNCVGLYRNIIRLRKRLFELYLKENSFSETEAMAVMICLSVAGGQADEALAKLAGLADRNAIGRLIARFQQMRDKAYSNPRHDFWKYLANLKFKGERGRPLHGRNLILNLDAGLLLVCPRAYLHLLRDDLNLRLEEYGEKVRIGRKLERWKLFWKAVKAAEVNSRRIWMDEFGKQPKPPPAQWWLKIARQKCLTAESTVL